MNLSHLIYSSWLFELRKTASYQFHPTKKSSFKTRSIHEFLWNSLAKQFVDACSN